MLKFNKHVLCYHFIVVFCLALTSCATSNVSRDAACKLDSFIYGMQGLFSSGCNNSIVDTYQNSNQAVKGALIGGATGAVAGSLTSGIGALPGFAEGFVIGGALGAYIDANTTLLDRLENRGVKVILLGDQVLIVVFSNQLFQAMTPNIRYSAYPTLDLIARFINCFPSISVQVAAYTGLGSSPRINCILSKEQANNVVKYLWRRVNTRMMYALGNGGTNLVSPDNLGWHEGDNYRIEITLEKVP